MKLRELIMTWGTLGHTKDVEPLLVRLYDSHRIYQLAEDRKPEARSELSHIVSGLLAMDLKQTEKELIADILINLMRQAETDLRHAVAERLSVLENVPLRLVLFMAQDEIGVAETVLRSSPVLNDLDLLYLIQSRDSDYWRAIAAREHLNEPVVDALADTRDIPTATVLAQNDNVHFSDFALGVIAELAETSRDVARPLLTRSDIPEAVSRKIYEFVGAEMERTISSSLQNELSVLESVKDILQEFSAEQKNVYEPTIAMMKAAELFNNKGQLTADLMLKTLKRGQVSSFVAQIACVTGIKAGKVLDILKHENGHGLAAMVRAYRMNRDEFVGIYLMTSKLRSTSERNDPVEFNKAVLYFDALGFEQAQKNLNQYRL